MGRYDDELDQVPGVSIPVHWAVKALDKLIDWLLGVQLKIRWWHAGRLAQRLPGGKNGQRRRR